MKEYTLLISFPFLGKKIQVQLITETLGSRFAAKVAKELLKDFEEKFGNNIVKNKDLLLLQYPEEKLFVKSLTCVDQNKNNDNKNVYFDLIFPEISDLFLQSIKK